MRKSFYIENTRKEKSSLSLTSALASIAGIFILSALTGCGIINNDQSSASSARSESSGSFSRDTSSDFSDNTTVSKPDEISEAEQSYEDYIKIKYAIDIKPWEKYICPKDDTQYLILVNKQTKLKSNYIPDKLAPVKYTRKDGRVTQQMVETAEKALQALMLEAEKNGITDVSVTSAYRSYSYQEWLFNDYVSKNLKNFASREECEKYVETFSARPGTSEHQTGLVCDMHNLSAANASFATTKAGKWLAENSYRFGFILRYPENKTEITGYQFEPWHFRFVGRTAATEMYINGMCLEEYIESLKNKTNNN